MGELLLPQPSTEYDMERERVRNARIREAINMKLDTNRVSVFGGIPRGEVRGSNAAFIVPPGPSVTLLPFDTAVVSNIDIMTVPASIKPAYAMDVLQFLRLHHNAGGSGAVKMTLSFFINAVLIDTYKYNSDVSIDFDIQDTYSYTLTTGGVLTVGMNHDLGSNVTIDMTKSKLTIMQLTPNPKYVDKGRF